ncbi:adenylyltransferase/cytidyltransferase family protein [Gracilinema caldarium]|uniref:adenylyltransferase/cytidyltransferase family protein n=1 Tax=Gracilinema caldarium TaxID=215591 RepID=UPI0026F13659|nr:adenylyltransferase/cytidyltransferase family protein [Gracilinema caldarium]MCA1950094.1 adenylyltransferase/cytidyltransferase family protein [Treponema sp.]
MRLGRLLDHKRAGGIEWSTMYKTGLTVGKFAPLHRGHQHLIETALAETEHLIVVVYQAKSVTPIPLEVRAGWIRTLYPQAEVLEAPDAPEISGNSPEIRKIHEEFLRSFMAGRKIDVFFSSEAYGDWAAKVLHCDHRVVDRERIRVPISATDIRANREAYSHFLDPIVLADLEKYGDTVRTF